MNPTKLDHVAYWVADRDPIADFVTAHLGMHVIDQTERFTLLGSNARRGKITLFDAEGPRERGALGHVAFRVSDLDAAAGAAPAEPRARPAARRRGVLRPDRRRSARARRGRDRRRLRPRPRCAFSATPEETAAEYGSLGFAPAPPGPSGAPRVEVGGAWVEFHPGEPGAPEKPLLNHLAVLVDSADEHIAAANDLGVEIDDVVDAPNTLAVFLWGPERVRVEYVEHKPTFSLT